MPKLKVFRAASGFYDSYVAAPSRAAALRAWGAKTDLFGMGAADEVTEPALVKAAIAQPGVVFKRKRSADGGGGGKLSPAKRPLSRKPSRKKLEETEAQLVVVSAAHEAELNELTKSLRQLERARRDLIAKQERAMKRIEANRDQAAEAYHKALERWQRP